MIIVRKSHERGRSQIDWLDSYHTFSFADYYDPDFMGFASLRVINEDTVEPGQGFGTHPHHNMEIISYVIDGALEHKDSMGTGSVIKPGEIQRMSAGTGVRHSEFNHSNSQKVHFLQIWIIPERQSLPPGYEQKKIPQTKNSLVLIGSREGGEHSITIHQDVALYQAHLDTGVSVSYELKKGRKAWVQIIKGSINLNGHSMKAGDGAAIFDEKKINATSIESATFLLFDL